MPEITLHSELVYVDEIMDLPKGAKIFHIEYIDDEALLIFYTTSRVTYAEQLEMGRP